VGEKWGVCVTAGGKPGEDKIASGEGYLGHRGGKDGQCEIFCEIIKTGQNGESFKPHDHLGHEAVGGSTKGKVKTDQPFIDKTCLTGKGAYIAMFSDKKKNTSRIAKGSGDRKNGGWTQIGSWDAVL